MITMQAAAKNRLRPPRHVQAPYTISRLVSQAPGFGRMLLSAPHPPLMYISTSLDALPRRGIARYKGRSRSSRSNPLLDERSVNPYTYVSRTLPQSAVFCIAPHSHQPCRTTYHVLSSESTQLRGKRALSEPILNPRPSPVIQADAYFFDIDGTLIVSRDLVHWHAMHRAMLEVYGLDANFDGIPYHGKTDVAILRMALTRRGISNTMFDERLPSALEVVRREVAANVTSFQPDVCPSVPKLLAEIRHLDKLLGVASGNLESVGWNKLKAAGIRNFFTCGSFGDNCELRTTIFDHAVSMTKSELGNSASVCFVGDTPDDIQAARSVGARIIAVGTGIFGLPELATFQPDLCCQSCDEALGRVG